ncbi:MAG: hypothetical protein HQK96_14215 [Nitrospirae bacterium]|nr:hypothetical protein [Nitrospirota bacterium]
MKVADLSIEEFTELIESILDRKYRQFDPDEGLELSDECVKSLKESLEDKAGRMSHEDFMNELKKDNLV